MKKILLKPVIVIAFLLLNYALFAQRWEATFGVSTRDEYINHLTNYYDKGIYIVGGFDNEYGWHIKTDANGNLLWDKTLMHSDYPLGGFGAAHDDEGNMYVVGEIFMNQSWPFIAKFNACGEKEWCRVLTFGTFLYGYALDVLVNENNEVIVLLELESEQRIDEIFLSRFDKNGNMLWINSYASKKNHPLINHRLGYSVTEHNKEYIINGYCYWPYPNNPNHVYLRPFFIGVDENYKEKWILPFACLDSVFGDAFASIPLNDTMYMGVGMRRIDPMIEENAILMFFDHNGKEYGYKQIPNSVFGPGCTQNYLCTVERVNDSLFIGSGSIAYEQPTNYPGGEMLFDTTGKLHNFYLRPFNTTDGRHLIKTYDNNFVVATAKYQSGSTWKNIYLYKIDENLQLVPLDTNQYVYDSLCGGQIQSGEISMNDCVIITGIEEQPTPEQYYARLKTIPIKVFPNPAKDKVMFDLENTSLHQNIRLRCYDLLGKLMYNESVIHGQRGAAIDISSWPPGMYVAVVYSNGGVVGKSKFVINQ